MTPVSEKEFVDWLVEKGLIFDKKSGHISFSEDSADSRFWLQAPRVPRLIYFIFTMFDLIGPWENIFLFRQGGSWLSNKPEGIIDRIQQSWLSPLGLPVSGTFALRFSKEEVEHAISLFTYQQMFGMSVWSDTYAVPDNGGYLVQTSHHDVINVFFKNPNSIDKFIEALESKGFPLPTRLPDATFKVPHWMKITQSSSPQ